VIDRRAFLGTVALAVLAAPRLGEARPILTSRVPRVGVLGEINPIGWTVKTAVADIECRWAEDRPDRLPQLASQLVAGDVDVIVALGAASGRAASQRTTSVPIVVVADGDSAEDAVIAALARSTGNITWLSVLSETVMAQHRLRLLATIAPELRRVAVLFNPETVTNTRAVARLPGLLSFPAQTLDEIERAFLAMTHDAVDGLLVLADTLFAIHAARLVELAAEARLPAVYGAPVFVELGGLLALYGDTGESIRRTATIVRRALAGERPAALWTPTRPRPQVAANALTASRLGLALPPAVLARAGAMMIG
jgi:putative ABC transport system substrate-binding protein